MTTPRKSVLVVDDDADIREVIATILEAKGYPAAVAADGTQALRLLDAGLRPGVILLDLMMPIMTGAELKGIMASRPDLAGLPVILISGDPDVALYARDLAADGYLQKPIELEELMTAIASAIAPVRD